MPEKHFLQVKTDIYLSMDISDIDNLPTGGRGLQITQAIADHFSYERINNRNCLVIHKYF
jgi:anti-sigma regulatory factor (Ser/Thr protein kinase)